MNNKFDELAKGLAQSVTRRSALKRFGVGLAGLAVASLGLTRVAQAEQRGYGNCNHCVYPYGCNVQDLACVNSCGKRCIHGPKGGGL